MIGVSFQKRFVSLAVEALMCLFPASLVKRKCHDSQTVFSGLSDPGARTHSLRDGSSGATLPEPSVSLLLPAADHLLSAAGHLLRRAAGLCGAGTDEWIGSGRSSGTGSATSRTSAGSGTRHLTMISAVSKFVGKRVRAAPESDSRLETSFLLSGAALILRVRKDSSWRSAW